MIDPKVINLVNTKILPEFAEEDSQLGILVILEIASALITLFQQCPNLKKKLELDSEKILNWLRHPSFLNKARLYLTIKRQCRKNHTEESLHIIVNAIQKASLKATKEDVETLCDAASGQSP